MSDVRAAAPPSGFKRTNLEAPKTILGQQLVKLPDKHANQYSFISIPNTSVMFE